MFGVSVKEQNAKIKKVEENHGYIQRFHIKPTGSNSKVFQLAQPKCSGVGSDEKWV